MGTQSSTLRPPPNPARIAMVDSQGMLTRDGFWFLYQLFKGAQGAEATAILEAIDGGTEGVLSPQFQDIAGRLSLSMDLTPGIGRAELDEVLGLASFGDQVFNDPRIDDIERLVWSLNDQPANLNSLANILTGTHAQRLTTSPVSYATGTLFFETDRRILYVDLAAVWTFSAGVMIAAVSTRPTDLVAADYGFLFLASDTLALYYWNGTTWVSILGGGTASTIVTQPGGGVTLNGQGLPSQGVQPPAGVPIVTSLPGSASIGDKVAILDASYYYPLVYTYTPPLSGAGAGWWNLDVVEAPAIQDTFANLGSYSASSYRVGTVFNATDRKISYGVQIPNPAGVKTWVYYNGIFEDVLANIPVGLGVNDTGFIFRASDYLHNWRWSGTAWSLLSAAQSGLQGGSLPGTMLFSLGGPPFGGSGALWHLCDGSMQLVSQEDATLVNTTLPTIANTYFVR